MRLAISHTTNYTFESPVVSALQQLRLTPRSGEGQNVLEWQTTVEGGASQLAYVDEHDNRVELVGVDVGARHVAVHAEGLVETTDTGGVLARHSGLAPMWLYRRETPLSKPGRAITALVAPFLADSVSVTTMHALSAKIRDDVDYVLGSTSVTMTGEEALVSGSGVCQDHAHIFASAARMLGLPARYVSGYLMMDDRVDQDATHAWAEVWIDGLGWVGFDVSNGISPDERYVRMSVGLDYREASPIVGIRVSDGAEDLTVSIQVQQQ